MRWEGPYYIKIYCEYLLGFRLLLLLGLCIDWNNKHFFSTNVTRMPIFPENEYKDLSYLHMRADFFFSRRIFIPLFSNADLIMINYLFNQMPTYCYKIWSITVSMLQKVSFQFLMQKKICTYHHTKEHIQYW